MTEGPAGPPPGWYPDPGDAASQRWWDGYRWTDQTRRLTMASDWRAWFATSPGAETVGRVVACAAALCATGAFLVSVALLIRDRPLDGAPALLVLAIPTIAVGQLWAIGLINSRMPPRAGNWRDRVRANRGMSRNPQRFFFGDLPSKFGRPLLALAFLGWLSAMTAFPALVHGGPADPGGGCAFRLSNHGSYTCVSQHAYEHAGAGEQRFVSGILLGFFAIQTGAAIGGLYGRRRSS